MNILIPADVSLMGMAQVYEPPLTPWAPWQPHKGKSPWRDISLPRSMQASQRALGLALRHRLAMVLRLLADLVRHRAHMSMVMFVATVGTWGAGEREFAWTQWRKDPFLMEARTMTTEPLPDPGLTISRTINFLEDTGGHVIDRERLTFAEDRAPTAINSFLQGIGDEIKDAITMGLRPEEIETAMKAALDFYRHGAPAPATALGGFQ